MRGVGLIKVLRSDLVVLLDGGGFTLDEYAVLILLFLHFPLMLQGLFLEILQRATILILGPALARVQFLLY
jgi:hypothetical protein